MTSLFTKESPEAAEQPQLREAIIKVVVLPTYTPLSVPLPSPTPPFAAPTRRLTAVCCSLPILVQCDGGSGASMVFAAAHRRSTASKFSRACGGPFFARLRRAPVASSAQRGALRRVRERVFCVFPYRVHVVVGVKT